MPVDEISARLRARLQEEYGVDEAAILMDRPPGGWGDLVTNQSLDQRLAEFEARFEVIEYKSMAAMERGFRDQTWRLLTAMLSMMAVLIAVMAALIKL
jgi:hypothetical protein